MADLLDQESVDEFRQAIRDVLDTFQQSPVILRRTATGEEINLLVGLKPLTDGAAHGELQPRETGEEIIERYEVRVGHDLLVEKGLIGNGAILIAVDDSLTINGKRFYLECLADGKPFRDTSLQVIMEAVR